MPPRPLPTEQEVKDWIHGKRNNWGRWGKDDQKGAMNLITPGKRVAATRLVKSGRSVSLSRPFPTTPGVNNALPAQHYMKIVPRGKGGFAGDYYGIFYHGVASTHIDALCHTWDEQAMWNGRDPKKEITFEGATFGSIDHWSEGIITRAVMLDVPRHRGVPCVTEDTPVHGWELDDILLKRNITLEPGDAVCVYSGREAWQAQDPEKPYSKVFQPGATLTRPGLHVSCLPFLRDHDVSILVWDMLDHLPIGYDIPWAVHACLFAYGCALLDNALLEPLAQACVAEGRDEFMLVISPLRVIGGTGSPANPLALF
ncbi:MAG TPA: cyclase family protein [Methylomirabilota bacterium]|nr:cyclase family protein [Methylomirabilota bacterium]